MQGAAAALPELVVAVAAEEEAAPKLVRAVLWMANARQLHLGVSCSFKGCLRQHFPLPVPIGHVRHCSLAPVSRGMTS